MNRENIIFKVVLMGFFSLFLIQASFAAAQILDVLINESATEQVLFNPLNSPTGLYANTGENQSLYTLNGTITISNVHGSDTAENIIINISPISNIYNVTYLSGS